LGTMEPFLTELWPLNLDNSYNLLFLFIFFALVARTKMKFVIQFTIRISRSSYVLDMIGPFLTEL
jgi:hypothetical protein